MSNESRFLPTRRDLLRYSLATPLVVSLPRAGFAAEPGVTPTKVTIGAFLPLEGGYAAGANQMRDGTDAYFQSINDAGGIHGRKIQWIVENDSYNPQQTMSVVKSLVDRHGVFAIVCTLGTCRRDLRPDKRTGACIPLPSPCGPCPTAEVAMPEHSDQRLSLYSQTGDRKYINRAERQRVLQVMERLEPDRALFSLLLAWTGGRLSEVLAVCANSFQVERNIVALRTLKRRRPHVREVPIPPWLMTAIDRHFGLQGLQRNPETANRRLWQCSSVTAWRFVKGAMLEAGIVGRPACPRGLRHGFGVGTLQASVPLNMVQKWMGHARISDRVPVWCKSPVTSGGLASVQFFNHHRRRIVGGKAMPRAGVRSFVRGWCATKSNT